MVKLFGDIGDIVMRDRELLAKDGVVIISANINPKSKKVVVGPEIVSKGFMFDSDELNITEKIKQSFATVSENYLTQKFINWSEFKNDLRSEVASIIFKTTKRSPIIIPVLISTDTDMMK